MDWKWLIAATLAGILMGWWDCHGARSQEALLAPSPTPLGTIRREPWQEPYDWPRPLQRPPRASQRLLEEAPDLRPVACWYVTPTAVTCGAGGKP